MCGMASLPDFFSNHPGGIYATVSDAVNANIRMWRSIESPAALAGMAVIDNLPGTLIPANDRPLYTTRQSATGPRTDMASLVKGAQEFLLSKHRGHEQAR